MGDRYVVRVFGDGNYATGSPIGPDGWTSTQKNARKFNCRPDAAEWIRKRYNAGILTHLNVSIRRLKPRAAAPAPSGYIVQWCDDPEYRIYRYDNGNLDAGYDGYTKPAAIFSTKEEAEKCIQSRIERGYCIPGSWVIVSAPKQPPAPEARG